MPLTETIIACTAAFVSTNIDDALLLLAFMGDPQYGRRQVVLGQYLGIGVLVLVSAVLAALAIKLPEGETRWLGVLPILLGLRQLWSLRQVDQEPAVCPTAKGIVDVMTVTISNGGDNVAVYVPLFAKIGLSGFWVMGVVFSAMTAVWCLVAIWLLGHRSLTAFLDRYGHRIVPFVLILIGVYVLLRG